MAPGAKWNPALNPQPMDVFRAPIRRGLWRVVLWRTACFCACWGAFAVCQPKAAAAGPATASSLQQTLNTDPNPGERLQALQTLQRNGLLDSKQIARSITDTSPAIRSAVIEMSAPFLPEDEELQRKILALCNDKSGDVRLRLLKSLPLFSPERTAKALARILTAQSRSPESWQAAVDVLADKLPEAARALLGNPALEPDASGGCTVLRSLGMNLATREEWLTQSLDFLHQNTQSPLWQRAALLEGLALPVGGFPPLKQKPRSLDLLLHSPEPAIVLRAEGLKKKLARTDAKP
jgi:hypothetical protein